MSADVPAGADAADLSGALAPPMVNGEVVFEAPWQGRLFGMARLLAEQGCYSWDEFRACLIRQISAWEQAGHTDEYRYYDHFLAAFQTLLRDKGLVDDAVLEARANLIRARPHGHDH